MSAEYLLARSESIRLGKLGWQFFSFFNQGIILNDLRIHFYKNKDNNFYTNCGAIAHKFLEALLDESDFIIRELAFIEVKMDSE